MPLETYFEKLRHAIDEIPPELAENAQTQIIRSHLQNLSKEGPLKTFAHVDDMLDICHVFSLITQDKNPAKHVYFAQVITALWEYIRAWIEASPENPDSQFDAVMANQLLDTSALPTILIAQHKTAYEMLVTQQQFSDFEDNLTYYGLWVEFHASLQIDLFNNLQKDPTFNPTGALQTYLARIHQHEPSAPSEDLSTALGCSDNTHHLFQEIQALKKTQGRLTQQETSQPNPTVYTLTEAGLVSFEARERLLQAHGQKIKTLIKNIPFTYARSVERIFNDSTKYEKRQSNAELMVSVLLKIMNIQYLNSNTNKGVSVDSSLNRLCAELWAYAAMLPNTDDHDEVFHPDLMGSLCTHYTPHHISVENHDLFSKAYLCTQPLVELQVQLLKKASDCIDHSMQTLKPNQKQYYGLYIALAAQLMALQCALINDAIKHPMLVTLTYPKTRTFELKPAMPLDQNLLWQYSTLVANTVGSMVNIPNTSKPLTNKMIIGHPHHSLFNQVTRETLISTLLQAAMIALVITGIAVGSLSVTYCAGSHTSLDILSMTFHYSIGTVATLLAGSLAVCALCGIAYQAYQLKAPLLTAHTGIHPVEYKGCITAAKQFKPR